MVKGVHVVVVAAVLIVLVNIYYLEDDTEEIVVVDGGGRGKSKNILYFHCYEVGRGIPYPIFITILILLI